jgi:hypothetical protein
MDVTFFETQSEFHKWLEANHEKASELQVGFYKKKPNKKGITYAEAFSDSELGKRLAAVTYR